MFKKTALFLKDGFPYLGGEVSFVIFMLATVGVLKRIENIHSLRVSIGI